MQNRFVKSFDDRLRDECLNEPMSRSLAYALQPIDHAMFAQCPEDTILLYLTGESNDECAIHNSGLTQSNFTRS